MRMWKSQVTILSYYRGYSDAKAGMLNYRLLKERVTILSYYRGYSDYYFSRSGALVKITVTILSYYRGYSDPIKFRRTYREQILCHNPLLLPRLFRQLVILNFLVLRNSIRHNPLLLPRLFRHVNLIPTDSIIIESQSSLTTEVIQTES